MKNKVPKKNRSQSRGQEEKISSDIRLRHQIPHGGKKIQNKVQKINITVKGRIKNKSFLQTFGCGIKIRAKNVH